MSLRPRARGRADASTEPLTARRTALGEAAVRSAVCLFIAARTGRWPRAQACGRMLVDIALLTGWLQSAGGLAAAQYLGIYTFTANGPDGGAVFRIVLPAAPPG